MQKEMLIEYLLLMEIGEAIYNVTNYLVTISYVMRNGLMMKMDL